LSKFKILNQVLSLMVLLLLLMVGIIHIYSIIFVKLFLRTIILKDNHFNNCSFEFLIRYIQIFKNIIR